MKQTSEFSDLWVIVTGSASGIGASARWPQGETSPRCYDLNPGLRSAYMARPRSRFGQSEDSGGAGAVLDEINGDEVTRYLIDWVDRFG